MDRREFTGLLATLAASPLVIRGRQAASSGGASITPPSDAALEHMRRLMEVGGVPGVAAGIVTPSGLSWHRLEGVVDITTRQPVDMKTMFPGASLVVEGHTDANGSDSQNLILSQDRADAVKQYLVSNFGLDAEKVSSIGYGEARPVATNETASGRARNRRIDLVIHVQGSG